MYNISGVVCSQLDPVDFTTNTSTQNDDRHPNTITYTCIPGFELVSGDLVRNCTTNASYDGSPPNCQSKVVVGFCIKIEIDCGCHFTGICCIVTDMLL